jgi:hypothetical protein
MTYCKKKRFIPDLRIRRLAELACGFCFADEAALFLIQATGQARCQTGLALLLPMQHDAKSDIASRIEG